MGVRCQTKLKAYFSRLKHPFRRWGIRLRQLRRRRRLRDGSLRGIRQFNDMRYVKAAVDPRRSGERVQTLLRKARVHSTLLNWRTPFPPKISRRPFTETSSHRWDALQLLLPIKFKHFCPGNLINELLRLIYDPVSKLNVKGGGGVRFNNLVSTGGKCTYGGSVQLSCFKQY